MKKPKVIVILGPTASGKSDLAVSLALRLRSGQASKYNSEVISADSRQVYKGLNIGTGKITKREMKGVPHHLLDVTSFKQRFSASNYEKIANRKIQEILERNRVPIICGGTGFYIDALLGESQIAEVPPNLALRKKLEKLPKEKLFKMLQKLDPERAESIDRQNPRRLIRAIEICKTIGKVPNITKVESKYSVLKIGIGLPSKILKQRINARLTKRLKQGMVAEAKNLHARGLSYKRMRELGLEYSRLADFLENKITKQELTLKLQFDIWHYAKRQMTYWKRDKNIIWQEPKITKVTKVVKRFLAS